MLRHAISHSRLLRESNHRVRAALRGSNADEQLIARRIYESPATFTRWESEHAGLLLKLAECDVPVAQVSTLKQATLRLLHGKALFQYLRSDHVRGEQRARVMAHFRAGRNYEDAVIAEHHVYLRKALSYLCAQHLGAQVVQDPAFIDPIPRYEQLYAEYFSLYCRGIAESDDGQPGQNALLPLLKQQLTEQRWAILEPQRAQPFLRREAKLRSATGDTMRLPTLGSRSGKRR